jgi:hypothetical protein
MVSFVVRPYLNALDAVRDQITRERDLLSREEILLGDVHRYPPRFESLRTALLGEAPRLFAGDNLDAASAALANQVTAVALTHRVFVQQSETRSPEAAGDGVVRLEIELRAVGDLEGILSFLRALESGPKLLDVKRIVITTAERLNAGASEEEEVLGVSATVSGYALTEAK